MATLNTIMRSRQKGRRSYSAVLGLFALILSSLFATGAAFGQAVVAFSPDNGSVDCGQSIFVDVTIDGTATDLQGFSLTFDFDPTYLTPVAVTEGGALTGSPNATFFRWLNEFSFTNTVEVDGTILGGSIAGPGTILTIEFAATANRGLSALSVSQSRFRDSNNADIPVTLPAGTVDNICNTAPVTVDDDYVVLEGGTLSQVAPGVLGNDTDFNGDILSATVITPPVNASAFSLNTDGSFSYTHDGSETTSDSFVYQADDGFGGLTQGTANITVTPVNDPPVVTNPGNQSSADTDIISLQIVATDAEPGALFYSAGNLPTGLTIDNSTGLISGTIACDASLTSPYSVTVDVDDGQVATQIAFDWTVTPQAAPAAIADLAGTQVTAGNDSDGTTQITLTWTGGPAEIYRKGFGFYPEYDDNGGAAPLAPVSAAQATIEGWVLVPGVVNSGDTDEPAVRDSYYYVAFAVSTCGNEAGVSNLVGGVLNYHLGDVTDGVTPGTGDNLTDSADISALGASYNVNSADGLYLNYLDVGPSTDFSPNGRPTTDNWIEFEDLMMFSLNYGSVSKSGPLQNASNRNRLTIMVPYLTEPGTVIEVPLQMQADGNIHGVSAPLTWDENIVKPVGYVSGQLLNEQGQPAVCFEAEPGCVDFAVFGRTTTGLTGEGVAAILKFEVLAEGDPQFDFGKMRVRGRDNQDKELELHIEMDSTVPVVIPSVSGLYANYPNPFNPSTNLSFGVAKSGPVSLRIYGLDGRLVRTVLNENMDAGTYTEIWDGTSDRGTTVASGIYYVRMVATDRTESRSITLVK